MAKKKKEKKEIITSRKCRKIKRADGLVMKFMTEYTFRNFYEVIENRFRDLPMYSVFRKDEGFTYGQFAHMVRACGSYFLAHGYEKGDRVAIMAESCPNWMVAYVAATSCGMIAVPVLPDFTAREARGILEDSGARALFLNEKQYKKTHDVLSEMKMDVYRIEDMFQVGADGELPEVKEFQNAPGRKATEYKINQKALDEHKPEEQDTASIIYTSGTTGSSKGVMLSHLALCRCADLNTDVYVHGKPGMDVLSILPLSHVYEFTIGNILTLLQGVHITFLGKPPAVSILLPALKEIRPHIMLSVPLLIEKVYRAAVVPVIRDNPKMKKMIENPLLSGFIHRVINKKIVATFGNRLKFFGVGGAPLDPEVERFLAKAGFPYALGYGLTETSPLIAACGPTRRWHHVGYLGPVVEDDEVIIDNPNEEGVGEILVKGPNVMQGYYKRPELDAECFTPDGFFRTGDLGYIDPKTKDLALKGRCKTMILGPAGENIYPEGIENIINSQEFVQESLVVPEDGGLIALIKIDVDLMAKKLKLNVAEAKNEAEKYVESLRKTVNNELSAYSKLSKTELQEEEFERTPTLKIKRFLYPKRNKAQSEEKKEEK